MGYDFSGTNHIFAATDKVGIGATPSAKLDIVTTDAENVVGLEVVQGDTASAIATSITNAGTGDGLFIDQNGNGIGINIDTEATTVNGINVEADTLTTGYAARFYSNSADATARRVVSISNDNTAAAGALALYILQDAAATALYIDHNADALAIDIEASATTTGIISAACIGASAAGSVAYLSHQGTTPTGIVLSLHNDGTGDGIFVNQDGNGVGLHIDNDGTANSITVEGTTATDLTLSKAGNLHVGGSIGVTGTRISAGFFTDLTVTNAISGSVTGNATTLTVADESADTTCFPVFVTAATGDLGIKTDSTLTYDASTGLLGAMALSITATDAANITALTVTQEDTGAAVAATIVNAGTGNGLFIDQNGNGQAIRIDSESTNVSAVYIEADALTTGHGLSIYSNSASTSSRNILYVTNDNTLATGTYGIEIKQDSTGDGLYIGQNGNGKALEISTSATSADGMKITASSLTTGTGLYVYSNSADTGTRNLLSVVNDNTAATGATGINIQQDAAQRSVFIDQNGNGVALHIDNDGTANSITVEGTTATDFTVSKAGNVNIAGSCTAGSYVGIPTSVYLPAEAAYLPATNPAVYNEVAGSTTYAGWSYLAFDDTTAQTAVWRIPVPDYNGGNIIVTAYSKPATTPAGDVTLQYHIYTIGVTNNEEFDTAVLTDTTVNISHSLGTGTLNTEVATASATIDPANVAADDIMCIALVRDVASDDLVGNGQLLGILIEYTRA